jgi:hypothetical protein
MDLSARIFIPGLWVRRTGQSPQRAWLPENLDAKAIRTICFSLEGEEKTKKNGQVFWTQLHTSQEQKQRKNRQAGEFRNLGGSICP